MSSQQEVGRLKVWVAYDLDNEMLACWVDGPPGCGCITCPNMPEPYCDCPKPRRCPTGLDFDLTAAKVMSVTFDVADVDEDFLIAVRAEGRSEAPPE
jgi:hypothetical protein